MEAQIYGAGGYFPRAGFKILRSTCDPSLRNIQLDKDIPGLASHLEEGICNGNSEEKRPPGRERPSEHILHHAPQQDLRIIRSELGSGGSLSKE